MERAEDTVPETLLQVLKAGGHRHPANLSLLRRLSAPGSLKACQNLD